MKNIRHVLIMWTSAMAFMMSISATEKSQGPRFVREPPNRVEFMNSSGSVILCSATGIPPPFVTWMYRDGSTPLTDASEGLRHVRPDGSLVFSPFSPDIFRQDLHDNVYKCIASNVVGRVVSRDVHVKAVIERNYKVQVYDEFVIRGNTAIFRCQVPNFVREYIDFVSWKTDDGNAIASTVARGGRFSVLPFGELHIRGVVQADSTKSYGCVTRHKLTGNLVASETYGRLFVTESHGNSPPKIAAVKPLLSVKAGESLEMSCVASGYPPPSYRWYKENNGDLIHINNRRAVHVEGSIIFQFIYAKDSGKYVCVANNTAGETKSYTVLTVTAPLAVSVMPQYQTIHIGRPATFNCTVSGYPIDLLTWVKDMNPLGEKQGDDRVILLSRDVLHIRSVQREDEGMYQCFAFNNFESAQSISELTLGDIAPTWLSKFSGATFQPGTPMSLACAAFGNPLPQITWLLDGGAIPNDNRFRVGDFVTTDGHVMSFVNISHIKVEDGGDYRCTAHNTLADVTHSARINVYGPPVTKSLPNITVVAGKDLVIRCPVLGYPLLSITWTKDGMVLPTNHRQKIDEHGKLLIQDAHVTTEAGTYNCKAKGQTGSEAQGAAHVSVLVSPKIDPVPIPQVLYADEGQKLKVFCTVVEGDSPIKINWVKNGFPLPIDKDVAMQNMEDSAMLVFRKVNYQHNGNYTCVASNHAASVNRTTHLIVNVPPRWLVEPNNASAVLGGHVMINCMADGYPKPRIYWKKSPGQKPSEFQKILSGYHQQVYDNGSLFMQDLKSDDSGHYLCQATNNIGAGLSKVVLLTIHAPPGFETKFVTHSVKKGQDAHLRCEASGDPPISIRWEKDKQQLDIHALRRLSVREEPPQESVVSLLTITEVKTTDSALYTCLASNQYGSDDTNIQLVVEEPPSPPVDFIVKEKTSRTVSLGWTPGFSGNNPIQMYKIKYKNTTDSAEETAKEIRVEGSETTSIVRGLLPASNYNFKIFATNSLGDSEPSSPVVVSTDEEVPSGPPLNVEVYPSGSHSLKVVWMPPKPSLRNGVIQGYYIGYKMAGTSDQYQYKNIESSNTAEQQLSYLTNLHRMTPYKVIVQAYNTAGAGPRSDEVTATTLEAAPPTSPTLVVSSVTPSSLTVKWDRHVDDTIVKGYVLHYKAENSGEWKERKLTTSQNQYTLNELKCGTQYRMYMTAFNSLGMGEPSETISTRTKGAAPVSPQKDVFLSMNSTSLSLNFRAWQSGGCPINHFSVHFRIQGQWKTVANHVEASQNQLDIQHLAPSREYTLRVSAHSDAGTTEAEYRFHTPNVTVATEPHLPGMPADGLISPIPFYKNLAVLLPVVISVVVLTVVIITVVVCLRKQSDESSYSEGSSRKGQNFDSVGLADFSNKSMKGMEYYEKSSYYSSPARKSLPVSSNSHRGLPGDQSPSLTIRKCSGWS